MNRDRSDVIRMRLDLLQPSKGIVVKNAELLRAKKKQKTMSFVADNLWR